MTIAACYISTEGVVLGADSTSTVFVAGSGGQLGSEHYYDFGQKVFELGDEGSTTGVVIWGLGSLGHTSYRTLLAEVADAANPQTIASLADLSVLAASMFWKEYAGAYQPLLDEANQLAAKGKARSADEQRKMLFLQQNLSGGFCLGGRWGTSRRPGAYEILFDPLMQTAPAPKPLSPGNWFWGCPNLIDRLIFSMDRDRFTRVIQSGKWTGTPDELFGLVAQGALGQPRDLPLREAIDWIYASVYTTIKAMKFSHLVPVCGGPIEVAVISTDRPFRWVRHKSLGEAVAAHRTKEDRP
jgi:hypothetical protein